MKQGTETIPIHRVTMLVPAQRFHTTFSLTQESPLSVVDEFALRLLAVCGRVEVEDFIKFFGFDSREGTEVLRSLVARDFVVSPDGTVALSESGRNLFPQGSSESPRLLQVEQRSDSLCFDLLDYRLSHAAKGDASLGVCNVLDLPDEFNASESPGRVQRAFQAQFGTYAKSRHLEPKTRLYYVSSVTPRTRFQLPVELDVSLRFGASVSVDIELDAERDDDSVLRRMVSSWYEAQCRRRYDDVVAWKYVCDHIPIATPTPPTLSTLPDFLERARSSGTTPLVGSLSVPSLADEVCNVIEDFAEERKRATTIAWMPAQSEFWFRSRSSWSAVDALLDSSAADTPPAPMLLLREKWRPSELFGLKKRFGDPVVTSLGVPDNVEVVVAPGAWCALWAWMKLGCPGPPVPVGFVSDQEPIVSRLTDELGLGSNT